MATRVLFLIACSPWQSSAQAALDLLLTTAVMDQEVHLCFTGAGVTHLQPGQDGSSLGLKTLVNQLPALELYGASHVYAEREACVRYGVTVDNAPVPVALLDQPALAELVASCDFVERFR